MGTIVRCEAELIGASPLGFSKCFQSDKMQDEENDAFEERCWRERMHVNGDGDVFIPPGAIKNCLWDCAIYLGEKIKGKSNQTYTKYFKTGIMTVEEAIVIDPSTGKPVKAVDVAAVKVMVPSSGIRGSGKKVKKNFPVIPSWKTKVVIDVIEPALCVNIQKVEEYLIRAGQCIGLLYWRPINGGLYGRFSVANFTADAPAN